MGKKRKIHYSGALTIKKKTKLEIFPGYAACCYGERARNIRRDNANTNVVDDVTCLSCLKIIKEAKESANVS